MIRYNQVVFELKTYEEIGSKKWDEFVASTENGSIHQTSLWKSLQEKTPSRGAALGYAAVIDGEIKAAMLCVRMRVPAYKIEWYYCGRGPVYEDFPAAKFLVESASAKLKEQTSGVFLRYDPYILSSDHPLLTNFKTVAAVQNYHPTDTIILNLENSIDELWNDLKKKRRYDIRKAQTNFNFKRISGNEATEKDIDDFYELLTETTARDKFSAHPKSYYADFLATLGEHAQLWFAEDKSGKRVATTIMTIWGDKAIYYFAAMTSDTEVRKLNPAHGLLWELVRFAESAGAKSFDLLGIAPDNQPDHPYAGITKFKKAFGGEITSYKPGLEISLRPTKHRLYRLAKRMR